jgi:hypothetical protein
MRELSAPEFALAVVIAVFERKSRSRLRDRQRSLIIDDCLALFEDPRLSPAVRRWTPAGFDPHETRHREMCATTLALFETIAPIVRVLYDDDGLTRPPRHRRPDRRSA